MRLNYPRSGLTLVTAQPFLFITQELSWSRDCQNLFSQIELIFLERRRSRCQIECWLPTARNYFGKEHFEYIISLKMLTLNIAQSALLKSTHFYKVVTYWQIYEYNSHELVQISIENIGLYIDYSFVELIWDFSWIQCVDVKGFWSHWIFRI